MAELISANFKGFEIEFDNTGAIYLNSELLVPENGIVKLSVEDKSANLIVADFFIEKFGVEQLGSFFDVSADFKIIKEVPELVISSNKKIYSLKTKKEFELKNGTLDVVSRKKTTKYTFEELFSKYFPEIKAKEVKLGNMLILAKTLNYKVGEQDLLFDGQVAFTPNPFKIYNVTESGFIVIPEGEKTHFVSLKTVM